MAKTPMFKRKLACKLVIEIGSGRSIEDEKGHVNFWRYVHFDMTSAVVEVVKL